MSRILFVGDLHTKSFLLPQIDAAVAATAPDRVILMGDYMDDWHASGDTNYGSALEIFDWARNQGDVTLLLGNHDMGYFSRICDCPGNNRTILAKVYDMFIDSLDLLKVAYATEDWLFTHAGLTNTWARKHIGVPDSAFEAAQILNDLLFSSEGREKLRMVGRRRGGWDEPSPLWADWSELCGDPYPGISQIVGHSPVETCRHKTLCDNRQLWCCDTFSTYPDDTPIGDGSMLLLDTDVSAGRTSAGKEQVTVIHSKTC